MRPESWAACPGRLLDTDSGVVSDDNWMVKKSAFLRNDIFLNEPKVCAFFPASPFQHDACLPAVETTSHFHGHSSPESSTANTALGRVSVGCINSIYGGFLYDGERALSHETSYRKNEDRQRDTSEISLG